jgi:hypothetical protein
VYGNFPGTVGQSSKLEFESFSTKLEKLQRRIRLNIREVTHKYRLNQWTQIIRECRSSEQTVVGWCAEHKINPKSYYYWLKRVRTAACEALPACSGENNPIVPLNIPALSSGTGPSSQKSLPDIVVRYGSVSLEIHNNASLSVIENTLRALQHVR